MQRKSASGMKRTGNQIDLKVLLDTPPWDWSGDAGQRFHRVLTDSKASESDRLTAAELAGDFTVIDDALSADLPAIVNSAAEPDELRARAAISFGAILDYADTLPRTLFIGFRMRCTRSMLMTALRYWCGGGFLKRRCARPRIGIGTQSVTPGPAETGIGC
jgi:hypothetical protein